MNDKQYNMTYLIPIAAYIKQLEQVAANQEWAGDLEACDATLGHLHHVREYQITTNSAFYPLH